MSDQDQLGSGLFDKLPFGNKGELKLNRLEELSKSDNNVTTPYVPANEDEQYFVVYAHILAKLYKGSSGDDIYKPLLVLNNKYLKSYEITDKAFYVNKGDVYVATKQEENWVSSGMVDKTNIDKYSSSVIETFLSKKKEEVKKKDVENKEEGKKAAQEGGGLMNSMGFCSFNCLRNEKVTKNLTDLRDDADTQAKLGFASAILFVFTAWFDRMAEHKSFDKIMKSVCNSIDSGMKVKTDIKYDDASNFKGVVCKHKSDIFLSDVDYLRNMAKALI